MRVQLQALEIYIINECNLTCSNCNRYNNYDFRGHYQWQTSEQAIMAWSTRITAPIITIIGGEPLLHPDLQGWVQLLRRAWPAEPIMIQSNGLVDRDLDWMNSDRNLGIVASMHQPGMAKAIKKKIPIKNDYQIIDNTQFTACAIRDQGTHFTVHDSPELEAFNACTMSRSHTILDGVLYKCPMVAILPRFRQQYEVRMTAQQERLLQSYRPLHHDCSDQDLQRFLLTEDQPVSQCALCPSDGVFSPVTFDPKRKQRHRLEAEA